MAARAGRRAAARLLHAFVLRPGGEALAAWLECSRGASSTATGAAAAAPCCNLLQQYQQQRWTTGPGKGTTHNTNFPTEAPYHPQVLSAC